MREYIINMKFVTNRQMFVMMVLACIYEEVKRIAKSQKNENGADGSMAIRMAMDGVMMSYRYLFNLQEKPEDVYGMFDGLEALQNTCQAVKLQSNVNLLMDMLPDKIQIDLIGGRPEYMSEVLPDFKGMVSFKSV